MKIPVINMKLPDWGRKKMEKFFIKETFTDILKQLVSSKNWDFTEVHRDVLYAGNYVPQGNNIFLTSEGNLKSKKVSDIREMRYTQVYHIVDKYFPSWAELTFFKEGIRIKTAMSGFLYEIKDTKYLVPTKGGKRFLLEVTYKGAKNGLLAQSLLPKMTPWDIEFCHFRIKEWQEEEKKIRTSKYDHGKTWVTKRKVIEDGEGNWYCPKNMLQDAKRHVAGETDGDIDSWISYMR